MCIHVEPLKSAASKKARLIWMYKVCPIGSGLDILLHIVGVKNALVLE